MAKVSKVISDAITSITGVQMEPVPDSSDGTVNLSVEKTNIFAQDGMVICIKGGPPNEMIISPEKNAWYPGKQTIWNPKSLKFPPLRIQIVKDGTGCN